jgi:hypothetical protein
MMAYNRGGVALRIAPADWFRGEAGVRSVAQSLTRRPCRDETSAGIFCGIDRDAAEDSCHANRPNIANRNSGHHEVQALPLWAAYP